VKRTVELDEESRSALTFADGRGVIEVFRATRAEPKETGDRDSFSAFRAAKVGASANWALEAEPMSAAAELMRRVNPSIVVVTFGANDAAAKNGTPEELADEFERHVLAIVRFFEERGVVVILSGEMRHGDAPGVKACPSDGKPSDWAIAVATNATVARMAEIACRDHLPFIDLRHALDRATNYGLGPDAVHMTTYQRGAGVLDERGLDCGNNIRNFVTLLALKRVREALLE
ncbi:MAG: SGNH/GDSL hydrolase family protein, partial [Myxococcales bacterium]|nr:SGNH/GDSL hydrolase family protein [Myxococcales bacterium]